MQFYVRKPLYPKHPGVFPLGGERGTFILVYGPFGLVHVVSGPALVVSSVCHNSCAQATKVVM